MTETESPKSEDSGSDERQEKPDPPNNVGNGTPTLRCVQHPGPLAF